MASSRPTSVPRRGCLPRLCVFGFPRSLSSVFFVGWVSFILLFLQQWLSQVLWGRAVCVTLRCSRSLAVFCWPCRLVWCVPSLSCVRFGLCCLTSCPFCSSDLRHVSHSPLQVALASGFLQCCQLHGLSGSSVELAMRCVVRQHCANFVAWSSWRDRHPCCTRTSGPQPQQPPRGPKTVSGSGGRLGVLKEPEPQLVDAVLSYRAFAVAPSPSTRRREEKKRAEKQKEDDEAMEKARLALEQSHKRKRKKKRKKPLPRTPSRPFFTTRTRRSGHYFRSPVLAVPFPCLGVACSRLGRKWIPVHSSSGGFSTMNSTFFVEDVLALFAH